MSTSVSICNLEFEFLPGAAFTRLRPSAGANPQVPLIAAQMRAAGIDGVDDVIATDNEIMIRCVLDARGFAKAVAGLAAPKAGTRQLRLPVTFEDADDWREVTRQSGLERDEVVSRLTGTEFSVAMHGFVPGFAYLAGLPDALHCERKAVPAVRTRPGSMAIGGKYAGVYALESPAGWYVLGRTPVATLNLPHLPPSLLEVGDTVVIEAIDRAAFDELVSTDLDIISYSHGN